MRPSQARIVALLLGIAVASLSVQPRRASAQAVEQASKKDKDPYRSSRFWESKTPFEMTLSVNLKQLQADKVDSSPWRDAIISYDDGAARTHAAMVRTRGKSRLRICERFPPIWVDFAKDDVRGTALQRLNRFKLVSPCKFAPDYERYVIGEYNIYRIHELFTPISHRTRLIKLTVKDSASGKEAFTKHAFAVEDIDEVAERNGGTKLEVDGLVGTDLEPRQTAIMGLLQYMIGNTDFSYPRRHNVELVNKAGVISPINYDYDQSGIINAIYAIPDASLPIRKVTERVYRGLCVPPEVLRSAIAEIKAKRPEIEALYRDEHGKLMGSVMTSSSIRYLNSFFADLDNERRVQREIAEKCLGPRG